MAALSEQDRRNIWAAFMRDASKSHTSVGPMTKTELRAAVDSVDDWIDDNAASFLASFPEPAASALTNRQKVSLLFAVAQRRWEVI